VIKIMEVISEKVGKIEFRILGPKLIERMAVVKIVNPELYDADGYPIDGGLMDLHMGVIDPGMRCKTCGEKVKECPGHFGYITLARPVLHIKYVPWIYEILRCTCRECSRILISEERIKEYKDELKKVKEERGELESWVETKNIIKHIKSAKKCPYCGTKQRKIKIEKPYLFYDDKVKLTPVDIRERLERVKDNDLKLLGFDPLAGRPEWMILTLLPVPPTTVRPSITLESGARSEDDLTHKLGDIVRANQRLYENLNAGAPEIIIEDLWDLLQYHVTTLFVNNVSQLPPARHRSGRPLKTFAERIKSKEGRFRKNLAGKRVDFSARTVISPDPNIKINEVGVPKEMALELTLPERVNSWNINWLKTLVKNGPDHYPGANYVITPDNKRKRITPETHESIIGELADGYIVERHLMNGDVVLFNRQPSLHRQSMMSHNVRVLPGRTFRVNLSVCKPYNADFDGDEMNLHVPQTEEAIAEAKILMDVNKNLITPRYGLPIIGCIKDHLVGAHLLTLKGTKISREDAFNLLSKVGLTDVELKNELSGKELFSRLLPNDFNFECKSKGCKKCADCKKESCPYDAYVKIIKGELKAGVIDEESLGAGSGLLLHKFIDDYGPERASEFLNKATKIFINYLQLQGLTILPSDSDLPLKAKGEIDEILKNSKDSISKLIKDYLTGNMQPYPRRTLRETLELKVISILNKSRNECSRVVENSTLNTGTTIMAESGGSGKLINLGMIAACVGQMALRGARINRGYSKRVLPHFNKDDLSAEPHGFIKHGYKEGLSPYEFFLHAIVGRDSLMDTSMRTPKSGYLQRRLINALQDLKVLYDGTVRDSNDMIIQFKYGEDGVDVSKTRKGEVL